MKNSTTTSASNQPRTPAASNRQGLARVVFGVAGAMAGLALVAVATMVFTLDLEDGFNLTEPHTFESPSPAIVAHDFTELADPPSWLIDEIRVQGTSATTSDLFVGVAPTSAVARYLNGVSHDEIVAIEFNADKTLGGVDYTTHPGTAAPTAPGPERIWVASAQGSNVQTLDWPAEDGEWTAVIMNADGSAPVAADLALGMKISGLAAIGGFAMVAGIASLAAGSALAVSGQRQLRRQRKSDWPAARPPRAGELTPTG